MFEYWYKSKAEKKIQYDSMIITNGVITTNSYINDFITYAEKIIHPALRFEPRYSDHQARALTVTPPCHPPVYKVFIN